MITFEFFTYTDEQWDQIRTVLRDALGLDADQIEHHLPPFIIRNDDPEESFTVRPSLRSRIELVSLYYHRGPAVSGGASMKHDDANDVLREHGSDGLREAFDMAPREKKPPKPKPANDTAPEFSEEALALTFADRHANQLRFVADWGRWLIWNGSVWKPDNINRVFTLSRKVCREMAAACAVPHVATAIASAKTVAAVERLARYDQRLATTGEQWDAKPYMLAVSQGVVDLTTGIETAPRRENHLTRAAACSVAPPGTPHPLWSRFLDRITNHNTELAGFLQRYIGYCATGVPRPSTPLYSATARARTAKACSSTPSAAYSATMPPSPTWAPSLQATPNGIRPPS